MNSKSIINKSDYVAMLVILIASGTQFFYRFHGTITLLIFLIYSIYYYYHKKTSGCKKARTFIYIYVLYILANWFIINPNHVESLNRVIPYIVFAIGSYMMLCKMDSYTIVNSLYQIVTYISIVSIIVFMLNEISILSPISINYKGDNYLMSYLHTIGWSVPFHRLAGLWWEPGAYQIVLNMTLFLKISQLDRFSELFAKKNITGLMVILIASMMTLSTTGYMTIAAISVYIFFKFNRFPLLKQLLVFIVCSPLYLGVFYLLYFSQPVQDKLIQSQSTSKSSYTVRYADNMAMIQMISERPIYGYGLGTQEYKLRSIQLDNQTSSNGDLFFMTIFGIPFYLFVLWQCGRMAKAYKVPQWIFIIFFILLNIGECFLYYPLVFLFLVNPKTQNISQK